MENWPSVAVATLTADRRLEKHSAAIPHKLVYPGEVWYYVNREHHEDKTTWSTPVLDITQKIRKEGFAHYNNHFFYDSWSVQSQWRPVPTYDQDQARLWSIWLAREMCRQFAIVKGAEWLFFLDADVVVPEDAIQKLFKLAYFNDEIRHYVVGGMVPGRGAHKNVPYYFFGEKPHAVMADPDKDGGPFGTVMMSKVQNSTMGCVMIHRNVFEWLGFSVPLHNHWYVDPNGEKPDGIAEDPVFGIWLRYILKNMPTYQHIPTGKVMSLFGPKYEWVVTDNLVAEHLGPLGD